MKFKQPLMKKFLLVVAVLVANLAKADALPEDPGYQDGASSSLSMPLMNDNGSLAKDDRLSGNPEPGETDRSRIEEKSPRANVAKGDKLRTSAELAEQDKAVQLANGESTQKSVNSAKTEIFNSNSKDSADNKVGGGGDDGFAPLDLEPDASADSSSDSADRLVTLGVPLENAHTLKARKGMAHFTRARSLLIAAVREFDAAVRTVDPSVVLDPIDWRLKVLQQAKDIEVVLSPEARRDDHSVAIKSMSNGLITGPGK